MLISIFGGILLGLGSGLVMRAGASLDSMGVLVVHTFRRTSFIFAEIIHAFNVMIFAKDAFAFGIESELYSLLTYFVVTRNIGCVIDGFHALLDVTIVSSKKLSVRH